MCGATSSRRGHAFSDQRGKQPPGGNKVNNGSFSSTLSLSPSHSATLSDHHTAPPPVAPLGAQEPSPYNGPPEGNLREEDGTSPCLGTSPGVGKGGCRNVSTLTDLSCTSDTPEVEEMSLLSKGPPNYTLRADCLYGYEQEDWLHTSSVAPENMPSLTAQQIEETLKYFLLCSERVGQVTKTYRDIEAVTHLLEEKERDLELAARIGQSLLKQNQTLTERNELLDEHLEAAKEEIAQLRHELAMRDELLQLYASTEESEPSSGTTSPMKRRKSSSSSNNSVHYELLQQKLHGLEEENLKLRFEACELATETTEYEEQEQQLMMNCVEELSAANKQVIALSGQLARKAEETLRLQEEASCLEAQIVELQHRIKELSTENEELSLHLSGTKETQAELQSELKELQDKYSECEDMLREAQEETKALRNRNLPNGTVGRYSTLAAVIPMDSLAAEIEGTMRRGLDRPAPPEYKDHPRRVFEMVKTVNQVRQRPRGDSLSVPGSCPHSARSSYTNIFIENKDLINPCDDMGGPPEEWLRLSCSPEDQDLEDPGQQEGVGPGQATRGSSCPPTPEGGALLPGSSRPSISTSPRSYLPDRLQIVKPLEGSVTLHHWQQLAQPNLGGVLQPRPGIFTKDFRELEVDLQQVYSLNDLEEDEGDLSPHTPTHLDTAFTLAAFPLVEALSI